MNTRQNTAAFMIKSLKVEHGCSIALAFCLKVTQGKCYLNLNKILYMFTHDFGVNVK